MKPSRSRLSRRHLLALCTFLVPLAVFAILGQLELRRQGDLIQAGLSSEAQLFLESAAQALEEQIDRNLPNLVEDSKNLLAEHGVVRTTLQLRNLEGYGALLDILVLNEQSNLVWPQAPPALMSLPLASDRRPRDADTAISRGLKVVDLLLANDKLRQAEKWLQALTEKMANADSPRLLTYYRTHFRLATVHRRLGDTEAARKGFQFIVDRVYGPSRLGRDDDALGLYSELALAEMGSSDDQIDLLERIAKETRYALIADNLLTATVERIAEGIPEEDPNGRQAAVLLVEERQRARTRRFASDYNSSLKETVRRRLLRQANATERPDVQVVTTLAANTTMLWVRDATDDERDRFRGAAHVGLHIDLGPIMAPALEPFLATESSFVLAIVDPDKVPLLPAPATVPVGYVAPSMDVRGLTMSAYPADAVEMMVDANASNRNRVLLLLALFAAAMVGALWLWRSVSREAELATLKVDLVSRVSHELKTPLALIRMYGETLQLGRAKDGEQAQQFGGIIARESERLTTMIQRILDFSRQQAGTLNYTPRQVDLNGLLRGICDAYTPHLEARGAILSDMVRAEATVYCDENACESAVVNLLENAAKYAIEGDDEQEIEIGLTVAGGVAEIEVRDHGRGIPESECEHVFDPFYRATNSGEVRGAGIGLSLVRHFARAHGGDASAQPREGGGAVFRLTLPLAGENPIDPNAPKKGKPTS